MKNHLLYFSCINLLLNNHIGCEGKTPSRNSRSKMLPLVINTWGFLNATNKAWESVYLRKLSAIDAVEHGCTACEEEQCDGTVGYGGSPDENGETTLDAMIMDGTTMNVGAVAALRQIKKVNSVARHVLEHTSHSMLVGELATEFAVKMGFQKEDLTTNKSSAMWQKWKDNNCQPNYWLNVEPDPTKFCGPYEPIKFNLHHKTPGSNTAVSDTNHDTIGMIVIDMNNCIAAGTSTNGLRHKIPGRVGDSPIPGAGAYADDSVGAACATGDGDILMRFLPSFLAVEEMRRGASPKVAAQAAIDRIVRYYPNTMGGVVVANKQGEFGAACNGMQKFAFSVCNPQLGRPTKFTMPCPNPPQPGPPLL